jgi:hypothetical protein
VECERPAALDADDADPGGVDLRPPGDGLEGRQHVLHALPQERPAQVQRKVRDRVLLVPVAFGQDRRGLAEAADVDGQDGVARLHEFLDGSARAGVAGLAAAVNVEDGRRRRLGRLRHEEEGGHGHLAGPLDDEFL